MLFTLQFVVIRACLSKPNSNMECGSEALYTYNVNMDICMNGRYILPKSDKMVATQHKGYEVSLLFRWWCHYCSDGGAIIVFWQSRTVT